ncbi:MAG: RHS repeat protein, partial [Desulfobacteraceae bacterium]|nr:RHS repeat protein [Desulfobacteraceae bacterium]NNG00880.1 RHS repeat protein [Desulfobacteraceae bacterium]
MERYTDGEDNPTAYTYDVNGNPATITYANNAVTRMSYDAADRLLGVTEASGTADERSRAVTEYDKMGNILRQTDFNGNETVT